jgi:DNA-binding protein HU-beta
MATKKAPVKKTTAPIKTVIAKKSAPVKKTAKAVKTAPAVSKKATATKKMTKTELVRLVAENLELTTKQAGSFFDLLAQTAIQETKKNGEFTIPGLGKLVKAQRAARIGRNPQTGESIKIKAKTTVKFRVAKAAKDSIAPVK